MQNDYQHLQRLIAKNVRTYREIKKISQEELAWQCGIDRTYISKIERGIANPSIQILHKISVVLSIELHSLIGKDQPLIDL